MTEAITDTVITKTVLQKFPFLDNSTIVSNTKTKKPVELSLLHYFVSCSLVNPSAEFIINQFKQTRLKNVIGQILPRNLSGDTIKLKHCAFHPVTKKE